MKRGLVARRTDLNPRPRAGVWERRLALVQECAVQLGMVFFNVTNMRAHQKAVGAAKEGSTAE